MDKNRVKKLRFEFLADSAAKLERGKSYKLASEVWKKAKDSASKSINQDWCDARFKFCIRMAVRSFTGE